MFATSIFREWAYNIVGKWSGNGSLSPEGGKGDSEICEGEVKPNP